MTALFSACFFKMSIFMVTCGTRTYLGYHILYLTLFSVILLWCGVLMWSHFIAAGLEERGVDCSFFWWTCCHYTKSDVKAWTLQCLLYGFYLHNHLVTTVKRWCPQAKVSVCTCTVVFVGLAAALSANPQRQLTGLRSWRLVTNRLPCGQLKDEWCVMERFVLCGMWWMHNIKTAPACFCD